MADGAVVAAPGACRFAHLRGLAHCRRLQYFSHAARLLAGACSVLAACLPAIRRKVSSPGSSAFGAALVQQLNKAVAISGSPDVGVNAVMTSVASPAPVYKVTPSFTVPLPFALISHSVNQRLTGHPGKLRS